MLVGYFYLRMGEMMFKYKIIKTANASYLYDGVTANILEVDDRFCENHKLIFRAIEQPDLVVKDEQLSEKIAEVATCVEAGAVAKVSDSEIEYWFDEKEFLDMVENDMCQLMIGITEKCNMRCRYCVYGGHYASERTHSDNNIMESTLLKAVDHFFGVSKNKTKIINFYGGEPFVNFSAIEKTVDYVETIDHSVKFYITTNGTLLSERIQEWFLSHPNVTLYVSLAGIPQRHDELRVLKNGVPTFNTIRENLLQLRNKDSAAFFERIRFIYNIFDDVQLLEIQEFFEKDELFEGVTCIPEVSYAWLANDERSDDHGRNPQPVRPDPRIPPRHGQGGKGGSGIAPERIRHEHSQGTF